MLNLLFTNKEELVKGCECQGQKQEQVTWKEYRDTVQACWDGFRKAKDLNLAIKGNKKGFYKYINLEKCGLLLNQTGDLVVKDMGKTEVLSAFSASFFAGKTSLQETQDLWEPQESPGQGKLAGGGSG